MRRNVDAHGDDATTLASPAQADSRFIRTGGKPMTSSSDQRLQHLERLCGQLLAQNHRLIERNAKLLLEIQAFNCEGHVRLPLSNVARIPMPPRLHPVR